MISIQIQGITYNLPYGTHRLGGGIYSINAMGIFITTSYGTKRVYSTEGLVCADSPLVVDILVKGLYRNINA
jgi:hypothetical protein